MISTHLLGIQFRRENGMNVQFVAASVKYQSGTAWIVFDRRRLIRDGPRHSRGSLLGEDRLSLELIIAENAGHDSRLIQSDTLGLTRKIERSLNFVRIRPPTAP